MRYFSVCSGIEAASVAWKPLGWQPVAFAEIEKFPSLVLKHHYPNVPNIGDMRNALKKELHADFDLLVGGTPCQSFSIAGDRTGLDDPRGALALVFCKIAAKYRPRWVVWENVPGALTAEGGEAFASITQALAQLGYHLAYRVLDAQYVRVDGYPRALPQRRRRVFLVGCLGDATRASQVLFDRESVFGGSAPSRYPQEEVARRLQGSAGGSSLAFGGNDTSGPITVATARNAHGGPHGRLDFESETFIVDKTLAFHARQDPDFGEVTHPLDTDGTSIGIFTHGRVRRLTPLESERLQGFPDHYTNIPMTKVRKKIEVTEYPKDGPRYKAIGNSMAVPCMRWIGQRIQLVETLP